LSIIGFVALVYLIYGFYKMFTASGDDWRKEAQKIVVWSLIALAIMGIAWFIVSRFFAIYEKAITPVAYNTQTEHREVVDSFIL
jgi:formate hydrogenlyase subunit 3/multisubunit Na+/H+ antiporter MnhD subunit